MKEEDSKYLTIEHKGHNIILYQNNNDWFSYSSLPSNVQHHLFSFRWYKAFDILLIIDIVDDFINFFNNKSNGDYRALFYLGKIADHTASTRLNIFKNIKDQALNLGFVSKAEKILSECNKTFDSINSEETYCFFTNHALMADLALLAYMDRSNMDKDAIVRIFDRILINLEAVFDFETGACKEHSVSYQEYNLNILYTIKEKINIYAKLYKNLEFINESINTLYNKVSVFSRFLLYSAYTKNKGYIPLGDSFEAYKPQVLKRVFNVETPSELLDDKYHNMIFFSESFGSYIYKSEDLILSLHNSLHSDTHKQDDDLSITLNVLGVDIFLDGGHHDIYTKTLKLKSINCHSLPFIPEKNINHPNKAEKKSKLEVNKKGFRVIGTHNRYSSISVRRIVDMEIGIIRIVDSVFPAFYFSSQYILSPMVELLKSNNSSIFLKIDNFTLELNFLCEFIIEKITVMYKGKAEQVSKLIFKGFGSIDIVIKTSLPNEVDISSINLITDNYFIENTDRITKKDVTKEIYNSNDLSSLEINSLQRLVTIVNNKI